MNLTRFLVDLNLDVEKVYIDAVSKSDEIDFFYLKEMKPNLILVSPTHPSARFFHKKETRKVLAIGQKKCLF